MPSFKTLVLTLGLHLNRRETETAFLVIDQDDDGLISYSEFQAWWHALDEPGGFQLV
jgi:Ca2+-binding EF-hand superfamily protein